jgi:hypothetical protein
LIDKIDKSSSLHKNLLSVAQDTHIYIKKLKKLLNENFHSKKFDNIEMNIYGNEEIANNDLSFKENNKTHTVNIVFPIKKEEIIIKQINGLGIDTNTIKKEESHKSNKYVFK